MFPLVLKNHLKTNSKVIGNGKVTARKNLQQQKRRGGGMNKGDNISFIEFINKLIYSQSKAKSNPKVKRKNKFLLSNAITTSTQYDSPPATTPVSHQKNHTKCHPQFITLLV